MNIRSETSTYLQVDKKEQKYTYSEKYIYGIPEKF